MDSSRRINSRLCDVRLIMGHILDIALNRKIKKYSLKEQMMRVLWGIVTPIFRFSPRICFGWRTFLLRLFGAKIGRETHIYNSVVIFMPWNFEIGDWSSIGEYVYIYNLGRVRIGDNTTISHRAHICAGTHDYTRLDLPLEKAPIIVEDQAWICADAFIGPGIVIGEGAVVGARAVAMKDVPPWAVVVGNPARVVKTRVMLNMKINN